MRTDRGLADQPGQTNRSGRPSFQFRAASSTHNSERSLYGKKCAGRL